MRLVVSDRSPASVAGDVVVGLFRPGVRGATLPFATHLSPRADRLVAREEAAATWFETRRMKAPRALLLSLGPGRARPGLGGLCGARTAEEIEVGVRHELRAMGARIERACSAAQARRVVVAAMPADCDPTLVLEGILLRAYRSNEWRGGEATTAVRSVTLCVPTAHLAATRERVAQLEVSATATNLARELGDLPSNVGTPLGLVARIRPHARRAGLQLRVVDMKRARAAGLGLFCGVAQGSSQRGCILELEHDPGRSARRGTLVLIGKGITHDTGGYNLKTVPDLYNLTHDKAGATAVIGAMTAIAAFDLPIRVVAVLPLAENCVDAHAFKPGDILVAMDGTSVFVENTDAEGRLVLADALCWAARYRPDAVVDLATLTRASAQAMGEPFASLFANDDRLRDDLLAAGKASDELLWPMPIHEDHDRELGHFKADLRNLGGPGGASSAAAFLRHFVEFPWAHVDLAGKAVWESPRDYMGEGATGFGCRLLVELARRFAARNPRGRR
jgi:leucyl aminopeptidase